MSCAIAMIIFRKFSACFSSWLSVALAWNLDSLVTPSTSWRHLGAEELRQLVGRGQGVLDGVVEQPGDDARLVELELGEDARHLEGMDEVGLARSCRSCPWWTLAE